MFKKIITIFLSTALVAVILLPSVLVLIEDAFDAPIEFSLSEEEENKSGEKDLDIEFLLVDFELCDSETEFYTLKNKSLFLNRKYTKPHLNIFSPPPEINSITKS